MTDKSTGEVIIKTEADDLRLTPLEAMRLSGILKVAADLSVEMVGDA
jgi:hypothetical protein